MENKDNKLKEILISDLGVSGYPLYDAISNYKNSTIVELGTHRGESTQVFLLDAEQQNNTVFGVDVHFRSTPDFLKENDRLHLILGDSSTVGKYWDKPVDVLFVDTFHIKQQVLSELYFWYPHVREGGLISFHDTNWPSDKHDRYGDIDWPRPEEAVKDFFNIPSLNYEDEFIHSINYPEKHGLTNIKIKKKKNYISEYKKWSEVFSGRNHLISLFWNEDNKNDVKIDLILNM